jgi:general secretion pathway protein K
VRAGRRSVRGAAIITAMLVVALAATVVSAMFWRQQVAVRSVENRLALSQARWVERAVLDWSRVILRVDQRQTTVDHLGEVWAVPVLDTRLDATVTAGASFEEGAKTAVLAGQIVDAQSKFNLASLVDPAGAISERHLAALRKLLTLIGQSEGIAERAAERVQQSVPRVIDNRVVPAQRPPMTRLADLADLPGIEPSAVLALEPYAIVLPRATGVNVNTAPPEVIAAMIEGVDLSVARRFVARRERTFYRTVDQAAADLDGRPTLSAGLLGVNSAFFLVTGVLRYDRVESNSETLLERMADRIEVIWQLRR